MNDKMEKIDFRKVRDFGELINDTIRFIKISFKKLSKSLILIMGPLIIIPPIIYTFALFILTDQVSTSGDLNNFDDVGLFTIYAFSFSLIGLIQIVFYQLIIYKFIIIYNNMGLEKISVAGVWKEVKKDFWLIFFNTIYLAMTFFTVNFLFILASVITIVLIPFMLIGLFPLNVYFATTFSLSPMIRLNEKAGFFKSLSRSIQLIYGNWWMTFGFYFVVTIIIVLLIYAIMIPMISIGYIAELHNLQIFKEEFLQPFVIAINSIITIIIVFLNTLYMVGTGFQYYNTVERKEGKALLERIENITAGI